MTGRALADEHALGLAAGELQDVVGYEVVEENDVGGLERGQDDQTILCVERT